ncbi:hypothetical protein B0H66DRAFT_140831 [Apodospora peruviana]|uniref:Uncharacterized protein n=1 Tax=Apodospora peruviana TaxID=516989 RepID=A0AAE0IJB8_9PEZI|nr:hypothetical protein B0H66DRAFT_140831 [Apodospora peruviana]
MSSHNTYCKLDPDQHQPFSINLLRDQNYTDSTKPSTPTNTAVATSNNASPPPPPDFSALLPASRRTNQEDLVRPSLNVGSLFDELCTKRMDDVIKYLWMVGRPMPPRPLHYQRLLSRDVFITERMDMHLVWTEGRIFIKPVPRLLLEPRFWTDVLTCGGSQGGCSTCGSSPVTEEECGKRKIWRSSLGFLLSYCALIAYESDFEIAKSQNLLPAEVTWPAWRIFVSQILADNNIYKKVSLRFCYGELRLSRLNKIYTVFRGNPRGYMYRWNRYGGFIRDNFTWLAGVVGYIAIILAALQVGLSTSTLAEDDAFQAFSRGFTIFSLVGPAIVVTLLSTYVGITFTINWFATSSFQKERENRMGIEGLQSRTATKRKTDPLVVPPGE